MLLQKEHIKKVSSVAIPNVPLFLFIYHVSRLKAFQKLGTASLQKVNRLQEIKESQNERIILPNPAMTYDFMCVCKSKPGESEKLLQCHNESCENGRFFHLNCLKYKRMPNNGQTTWICPSCRKKVKVTRPHKDGDDDVTFI